RYTVRNGNLTNLQSVKVLKDAYGKPLGGSGG
ncbi:MAG: hypothetical protein QOK25_2984, partial [Thermoleophilaceae bacterium]|nr:hypothetical protein [Thermoleophilaceae bacterium]